MTEATLVQPAPLIAYLTTLPFLGSLRASERRLVAGSWHELVLDYEVGASGVADGARLKITFKFYSDWAPFQTEDAAAPSYVSAEYQARSCFAGESPATVQSLKVTYDQKGHERPFQKTIVIDVVDGFLKPGDHVLVRLGDRRGGSAGTRVQTFVEKGFRFRAYVDPLGTSRFGAVEGDAVIDIVPGPPARLALVGPRWVRTGAQYVLRARIEDLWGNTCREEKSHVVVDEARANDTREHVLALPPAGWSVAELALTATETGTSRFTARIDSLQGSAQGSPQGSPVPCAPAYVTADETRAEPRAFFADLHVHSNSTIGTNDTEYNLAYGRDVAGLDVLGYTANDFNITEKAWAEDVKSCRAISEDGRFVCFPGTEWCGNSAVGGDHNVVFLGDEILFPRDREGKLVRSIEWNEHVAGDKIVVGTWPLSALYAAYAHDPGGHLFIPHVGGRRASLDWHHPELERLIEIGSSWGQFPDFYQDALSRGYELGASAAGDEHRGRCGGGVPGAAVFGVRGGLTGVLAPALSRTAVGQALRARHTWATTGEHLVGLLWTGDHTQGDRVPTSGSASSHKLGYRFLGDAGFEEVAAYDDGGLLWIRNLHEELGFSPSRIRIRWGGARLRDRYRAAVWTGTVRCLDADIRAYEAYGLEHPEETVRRADPRTLAIRTETYGDADSIVMDLSNLASARFSLDLALSGYVKLGSDRNGNPHRDCPRVVWEFTGRELLEARALRRPLGGADLFVAAERVTDAPLPIELTGKFDVTAHPDRRRPVYVFARQLDDSKVWTSPLFLEPGVPSAVGRPDRS